MSEGRNTFRGKVAFVTHVGTGIGRATALAFAREGASVAGQSREHIEETAQLIEQAGGRALAPKTNPKGVIEPQPFARLGSPRGPVFGHD